jgi:hypothetical protein
MHTPYIWIIKTMIIIPKKHIIEGSLEVESNFRQYGQMKSRVGQRQREEKD